jgi:hypothetical protein
MPVGDYDDVTVLRLTIRATGQFTFCRQFMRKSVSAARGARYNFEKARSSLATSFTTQGRKSSLSPAGLKRSQRNYLEHFLEANLRTAKRSAM